MRESLIDLIERMTRPEPHANSADSVSWHAHREAEKIDDVSLLQELNAFLENSAGKEARSAVYFIIGKIGKNCGSPECASVLIARSKTEKDKYALSALLDRLADIPKPASVDLAPVFALLQDKRWLVRHAAIRSLINTASAEAEGRILAHLRDASDPDDAICCHATLNRIGTAAALPALEAGLKSRKRDVKLSAQAAIEAIAARSAAR